MRRRMWVALLAMAASWGCDTLFVQPSVDELGAGAQLTLLDATGSGVISRVDHARVRIVSPAGVRRDTTIVVENEGGTVRARLFLQARELVNALSLKVTLLGEEMALYRGEVEFDARSGAPASLQLSVEPVTYQVVVGPSTVTLDAFGPHAAPEAHAIFETGEWIPGAQPTWTSKNPDIVAVGPDGSWDAKANGEAFLVASHGGAETTVRVVVEQVMTVLDALVPDQPEVVAGESVRIRVAGKDRAGYEVRIPTRLEWEQVGGSGVAVVNALGLALGVGPGDVTLRVRIPGLSQTQQGTLTVRPAASPPLVVVEDGVLGLAEMDGRRTTILEGLSGASGITLSPDRSHAAFLRGETPYVQRLYVATLDGDTARILDTDPDAFGLLDAEFSADGEWVYYTDSHENLKRIAVTGGEPHVLWDWARGVTTSPDGARVASLTYQWLRVQRLDGYEEWSLRIDAPAESPSWSPDGEWIACLAYDRYGLRASFVRSDGTGLFRVEEGHAFLGSMSWSPDGNWFMGRNTRGRVAVVSPETAETFELPWTTTGSVAWWR